MILPTACCPGGLQLQKGWQATSVGTSLFRLSYQAVARAHLEGTTSVMGSSGTWATPGAYHVSLFCIRPVSIAMVESILPNQTCSYLSTAVNETATQGLVSFKAMEAMVAAVHNMETYLCWDRQSHVVHGCPCLESFCSKRMQLDLPVWDC